MPDVKRSHDENRHKVCVNCLGKATKISCRITPKLKPLIVKHVFDGYRQNEDRLPCAICDTCRLALMSLQNPDSKRTLPRKIDHAQLVDNLVTVDVSSTNCTCEICQSATLKGNKASTKSSTKVSRGRPTSNTKKKPVTLTLCSLCKGCRHRGKFHKCDETEKFKNVQKIMSPNTQELVASKVIKEKSTSEHPESGKISLKTRGRPMNVTVPGIRKLDKPKISRQTLLDIQVQNNMSDNAMLKVSRGLRQGGGDVEPNFRPEMINRGNLLSDFFESKVIRWYVKEKDEDGADITLTVTRQSVMCKDVKGFVDYICRKREIADALYRVGIDGGQGFLKVCINIIDTRSDVSRKKQAYRDSGVKKLFILSVVQDKCEMYENLREILQNLHLTLSMEFILAADLKLCNIVAGIGNHSSKYPCTWCYATSPYTKRARFRTLGEIKWYHTLYVNGGRQDAMKYYSCINEPLITGDDGDRMLDLIPPPSLHLMLGVVNTLLDQLQKRWDQAYTWAANNNIVKKNYHGGTMEGKQCKKLLRKAHLLEQVLPENVKNFARAMLRFADVYTSCFQNELKPNFLIEIERFRRSYMLLGINITPKVHAVFDHVGEFCARKNTALAKYAEQASESVHHDFKDEWKHFKCDRSSENYAKRLRRCVVRYNSKHVNDL